MIILRLLKSLLALVLSVQALTVCAGELSIQMKNDVPFLNVGNGKGQIIILEKSADLNSWQEACRVIGSLYSYGDWHVSDSKHRFYRAASRPLTILDDWSNQMMPQSTPLFSISPSNAPSKIPFVKFTILFNEPDRVYFQNSSIWPYHYFFAKARLPGFSSMSLLQYNAQSLYANSNQRMVLGSVLRAPDLQLREVGIEITGAEAFPVPMTIGWIEAVKRRMVFDEGWRVFYMPSIEQQAAAEAGRAQFLASGIELDSLSRWITDNVCYSSGWALGRLVHIPSGQITTALGDGRLRFGDILVTDRVPAELPVLAGYLSLEPATPNSHVALLARSYLLPFAYAKGAGLQAEIATLHGKEVLLIVSETNGACRITLSDTTGLLTPQRRQEILDSKQGGTINLTPMAHAGRFHLKVAPLTPSDIRYVGGKAANFGFLRRSLPEESPSPAIAFTFDLWESFLAQDLQGGQTLRQQINSRLAVYHFPPDVNALRAELAAIRNLITQNADFNTAQRATIIAVLQEAGLQGQKIRFRSSTNCEDTESFSGAGLYDSYSGCLEDDLDSDTRGPSCCDLAEPNERGVFRAMKKVYASFYNENAFLERLRHGVDESTVGMAILVHFSTPDVEEMANGVATLSIDKTGNQRTASARIVTQLGAVSVTNPDPSQSPEVVTASYTSTNHLNAVLTRVATSSLVQDGASVMNWETDYRELLRQLNVATLAYEQHYTNKTSFELDFEFKRSRPGLIGLKQIRAVPHPIFVPVPQIP